MTERDKLIAQAEALEWADKQWAFGQPMSNISRRIAELRALAEQQPVDEPVYVRRDQWEKVRNHPFLCRLSMLPEPDTVALYTHPQSSAPADHTAADAPAINPRGQGNNNPEAILNTSSGSAVGVTDLDAPVALFTQTDYDAERWTALMLLWQLGQVTLTGDDAGMFVVDFEGAESADRLWKGKDPEECVRNVIESFTTEGWDFDAIRTQPSAPADHTAEVIATPPYFCSDGDRCHNLLNEALCAKQCQRLMPAAPADDLDALVAELETAGGDYRHLVLQAKCRHAITDLRAQLAMREGHSLIMDAAGKQQDARITRLEAENAEAREALQDEHDVWVDIAGEEANDEWLKGFANQRIATINLFLAKQGD